MTLARPGPGPQPAAIEIAPRSSHLWLCHADESRDLPATRQACLSTDERNRLRDFVFDRDRRRYATTRLVVRDILSSCVALPPEDLRFVTDPYGRPHLVEQPPHPHGPITLNISHTVGLIAVAVRRGARIGIDVEPRDRAIDVARMSRFLSAVDLKTLAAVPPDRQRARFVDLWTLKESYIKARGLGLRLPLHRFGIDFPTPATVTMRFDGGVDDPSPAWHLWQFHLASGHALALCTDRDPAGAPALVVQEIDPLGARRDIDVTPVRQSPT